jgi:murein tripeptide amidase MpaA
MCMSLCARVSVPAGGASYAPAWNGYRAAASYDMQHWFRVDTSYDEAAGRLTIQHTPTQACVRYAYFAPYSWDRHAALVMRMQVSTRQAS